MIRDWRTIFVISVLASFGAIAAAQDGYRPPPPRESGDDGLDDFALDDPDSGITPERMKDMLQHQKERNGQELRAIDEAIEMLNRGEPVMKVRALMREAMRDGRERNEPFREGGRRMHQPKPPRKGDGPPPPPPGDREGGGPPPGPRPLERLLGVLRETNPRLAERMEQLRRDDPEQFQRLFDDFAPRLARLAEERERLPDRWPDRVKQLLLQQRAGVIARDISTMDADHQEEAKQRLRSNLSEQFDLRLKFAREDLVRNKEQSERLEREIREKSGNKDAAIEKQMQEMIDRAPERPDMRDALGPGE